MAASEPKLLHHLPLPSMVAETKVQALINPDLGVWKPDLIHQLFFPYEATIILGIPLSRRCPPDKISWAYSLSGLFWKLEYGDSKKILERCLEVAYTK